MDRELSFGQRLKQYRKALDLTREELARRAGCAVETLRKLEQDARRPSRAMAERLLACLEVPQDAHATLLRAARMPRAAGDAPAAVSHTTTTTLGDHLPVAATPLIGREEQVAAIHAALTADVRLLTLTGPPGIGKTRLSLHAATGLRDHFADGVAFVPLAAVGEARLVAPTLAHALKVDETPGESPVAALAALLGNRQILLVLDNFEHVVEAAPVVAELLAACPRLAVLATSRVPLHIYGEHEYAVSPLALPTLPGAADARAPVLPPLDMLADYEAIRLFVARVRAVQPGFALTPANAAAVTEICARLDGLPLAIELTAARMKLWSVDTLLARLHDARLGPPLATLAGELRDRSPRQQTMRGALDWSYELLPPAERRLFTWLGVFAGSFTVEAVEAVAGTAEPAVGSGVADGLALLVEHSLLRPAPPSPAGDHETRLAMLEPIREYALERLAASGEDTALRKGHARYFLNLAETAEPELALAQQDYWLARLEREYGNILAALRWLLDAAIVDQAARMAAALWQFWEVRGLLSEGRAWLEEVLQHPGELSAEARADVLNAAGQLARHQGQVARAAELFAENLALRRQIGERRRIAYALNDVGTIRLLQGEIEAGICLIEEGLALFRQLDDRGGIADTLLSMSGVLLLSGRYGEMEAALSEGLALFQELGNLRGIAAARSALGLLALQQGNAATAQAQFAESQALNRQIGDTLFTYYNLAGCAAVAALVDDARRTALLIGAAEALRARLGIPGLPPGFLDLDGVLAPARAALGADAFRTVEAEGRAMALEQAVEYALDTPAATSIS